MQERLNNGGTILGVPVSVVDESALLEAITDAISRRDPTVFVGLYAALFRRMRSEPEYLELVRRSITYPDGFGVVRELHKRGLPNATRVATTDAIAPIARLAADNGWRVALYGAAPGVAQRAADSIKALAPAVRIIDVRDGFAAAPTCAELEQLQPDMLLVAIGAGRQEDWAYRVAVPAGVPAIVTCGGLFDFLAGDKRRAPAWMQRAGLEWLFRLMLEPRRLIGRYVAGNLAFLRSARAERLRQAA